METVRRCKEQSKEEVRDEKEKEIKENIVTKD